nr:hypothetical protein [Mycobacterium sp. UM_NZ2]
MSWFPVDDAFHGHPKARRAGFEALGLWVISGSYCMAYLTDGFVPAWFVKEKPRGPALAKRLVDAELWIVGEKDGEKGWWFHDWKPECTKAHVAEVRKKARQRKAKSRESQKWSHVTEHVTDAEPDAGVLGLANPTQPNPTHSSVETLGGEGPVSNARGTTPRPQCHDHPDGNASTPCGACQARREWDTQHEAQVAADEIAQRRAARATAEAARKACHTCAGGGWVLAADGTPVEPAVRCEHRETANA